MKTDSASNGAGRSVGTLIIWQFVKHIENTVVIILRLSVWPKAIYRVIILCIIAFHELLTPNSLCGTMPLCLVQSNRLVVRKTRAYPCPFDEYYWMIIPFSFAVKHDRLHIWSYPERVEWKTTGWKRPHSPPYLPPSTTPLTKNIKLNLQKNTTQDISRKGIWLYNVCQLNIH